MTRLARRLHALALTIRRATALADSREENVKLALRASHLEYVIAQQGRHVDTMRQGQWRYWQSAIQHRERAIGWRKRALVAERALADLEVVTVAGDR